MHHATAVAKNLYLDVPDWRQVAFDVDRTAPERCGRFGGRALQCVAQLAFVAHYAHTASTTTGGSLDKDWISCLGRDIDRVLNIGDRLLRTLRYGYASLDGQATCGGLIPHEAN